MDRLLFIGLVLLTVLAAGTGPASAQEPSRRLQDLMATARDLYQAKAFAEALAASQQALALTESEFGRQHERTGIQAYGVGVTAEAAGQFDVAERAYAQAVEVREAVYGRDSPAVAMVLEKRAEMLVRQGRPEAAEPHAQRALIIRQATIGPDHSFAAPGHAIAGKIAVARGNWPQALASFRQAVALISKDTAVQVGARLALDQVREQSRDTFVGLAQAAFHMRTQPAAGGPRLVDEGLGAAQTAWQTAAAGALARMTVRLGAGDTALGRSMRGLEDKVERITQLNAEDNALLAGWSEVQRRDPGYAPLLEQFRAKSIENSRVHAPAIARQRALVENLQKVLARCPPGQPKPGCEGSTAEREAITRELSQLAAQTSAGSGDLMALHRRMEAAEAAIPGYDAFRGRRAAVRAEIDALEQDVAAARRSLLATYPAYAALVEPGILSVADIQGLLDDGEALVVTLTGSTAGYVWAIDRNRVAWGEIGAGQSQLEADVAALRAGLDPITPGGWTQTLEQTAEAFDLDRAYGLYRRLLAPVESVLRGKRHLIVVPSGPLTSLPFQVLLTAAPPTGGTAAERLKAAPWLIRNSALSVLPSVGSLKALRALPAAGIGVKPFLGIGDPRLDGPGGTGDQRGAAKGPPARYYRNGLADVRAIRQLTPLPDTASELKTVAAALGADPDALLLGDAATERAIRATRLADYRILHFATHGLVAGDLSGLDEPALVLTPPAAPSADDDGLLTASEVAALSLAADWVVLSACNTAAGGSVGAEALSGLARAFLYAGARSLLVSHWSVYSEAATELTTGTFRRLGAEKGLARTEAFRRAMLDAVSAGRPPAYWAPFVVVGDGR